MLVKCIPVGNIEANCCIVTDENTLECAVIDPGDESNTILDYIESNGLKARAILLTHGHFDHTGAVMAVKEETGAEVWIHAADAVKGGGHSMYKFSAPEDTRFYDDGDIVRVGGLEIRVISTPGHSPGSVTLMCEDVLFTGDTLFANSCGRTDLEGGDMGILMDSLRKLDALPGNYEVWPGHMDQTTLDRERGNNYYMRYAVGQ